MGAVVDPFAGRRNPLTGRDRRRVTNDSHQIAMSAGLRLENAEAVFRVVKGDPLNEAGEHFLVGRLGLRFHANCEIVCFVASRVNPKWLEPSDWWKTSYLSVGPMTQHVNRCTHPYGYLNPRGSSIRSRPNGVPLMAMF